MTPGDEFWSEFEIPFSLDLWTLDLTEEVIHSPKVEFYRCLSRISFVCYCGKQCWIWHNNLLNGAVGGMCSCHRSYVLEGYEDIGPGMTGPLSVIWRERIPSVRGVLLDRYLDTIKHVVRVWPSNREDNWPML